MDGTGGLARYTVDKYYVMCLRNLYISDSSEARYTVVGANAPTKNSNTSE
jgi:hypothetical protein